MRALILLIIIACTLFACGNAPDGSTGAAVPTVGEQLFNTHCALCHGRKGDLGMNGAKDLTKSSLTRDAMIALVTNGRNMMMPFKSVLKPNDIEAVVDHALSLRTPK